MDVRYDLLNAVKEVLENLSIEKYHGLSVARVGYSGAVRLKKVYERIMGGSFEGKYDFKGDTLEGFVRNNPHISYSWVKMEDELPPPISGGAFYIYLPKHDKVVYARLFVTNDGTPTLWSFGGPPYSLPLKNATHWVMATKPEKPKKEV